MTLAAVQGKSDEDVRIAGGRSFDAVNRANARGRLTYDQRQARDGIRALERRGIIARGDTPEIRLRKILGSQRYPPEVIEGKIAVWRETVKNLPPSVI
jgi:hypothetical protein